MTFSNILVYGMNNDTVIPSDPSYSGVARSNPPGGFNEFWLACQAGGVIPKINSRLTILVYVQFSCVLVKGGGLTLQLAWALATRGGGGKEI